MNQQLKPNSDININKNKQIISNDLKETILRGVDLMADTVKLTLGTKGGTVMYNKKYDFEDTVGQATLTKDGVSVAKQIRSSNPVENMAIQVIREACKKTVASSGDGCQLKTAPVLTTTGWTTMGELEVGQQICGTSGTFQTVEAIYDKGKKELYEIYFSDGRIVECSNDHLWTITNKNGKVKTLKAEELLNKGVFTTTKKGYPSYNYYTPRTHVEFEKREVPIDPYLLGVLLGDGCFAETGSVEMSIGYDKAYILRKIDTDLIKSLSVNTKRNCIRVKFIKSVIKPLLEDLGLYGTRSATKFIPELYLYNSLNVRKSLLNGLLDTDGYINKRGLFEFSTISDSLKDTFLELVRSLGIPTNYRYHDRKNDKDSYSNTSIHRIAELKGYKYGFKIIDIKNTKKQKDMLCIKVSNPDHLYITNDYIVTHNTSSSAILSQALIHKSYDLLSNGMTAWEIDKYASETVKDIKEKIKAMSSPVDGDMTKVNMVASISANSEEIGTMISDIVEEVGVYGNIEAVITENSETSVELVKGMKLNKGYIESIFCTDMNRMVFDCEDVNVVVFEGIIRSYEDIAPYIRASVDANDKPTPIIFFCDDVATTALKRLKDLMTYNTRPLMFVEHDGFGDRKIDIMNDICLFTGAYTVDETLDPKEAIKYMGRCKRVLVNNTSTSIYEGDMDTQGIEDEIQNIERTLEVGNPSLNETKFLKKRLANLAGGIAVIHVGGSTKVDVKETKDRIDDAILAVRSALKDGVTIGGGYTWMSVVNDLQNSMMHPAGSMVLEALLAIPKQLLSNSNTPTDFDEMYENCTKYNKAYDLSTNTYHDIDDYKVFDATSVLLDSIGNAYAVSKSIMSVGRAVFNGIVYK